MSEPRGDPSCGISPGDVLRRPERHPACRRREPRSGSCWERENLCAVAPPALMGSAKGEAASGCNREGESTDAARRDGAARSSGEGSVMGLERRGCVVQPGHRPTAEAIWQREEPVDQAKPFPIAKREVWEAFKRVKANQGAAGVDGQSIAELRGQPFGQPLQALEPAVVRELFSSAGAPGRYSEGEWWDASVGHSDGCRPHRPGGRPARAGADPGAGVPCRLLRLQARQVCHRCRGHGPRALLALRLGSRSRHQGLLRQS